MTQEEFRKVCSRFATGIAVLTVTDSSLNPHGVTINSFTSVSADPPLVLVCLDIDCALLPLFESATHIGLSFLEQSQQDISTRFAFVPERRFEGVEWTMSAAGVPFITSALSWMECRIAQRIPAGDHWILIGEVLDAQTALEGGDPLIYFGSAYRRLQAD
jgi:flavin reductase (DIM6/NTAB) family NADH-FMN oxidoreductase RutF